MTTEVKLRIKQNGAYNGIDADACNDTRCTIEIKIMIIVVIRVVIVVMEGVEVVVAVIMT